jgi:hypothetical protein
MTTPWPFGVADRPSPGVTPTSGRPPVRRTIGPGTRLGRRQRWASPNAGKASNAASAWVTLAGSESNRMPMSSSPTRSHRCSAASPWLCVRSRSAVITHPVYRIVSPSLRAATFDSKRAACSTGRSRSSASGIARNGGSRASHDRVGLAGLPARWSSMNTTSVRSRVAVTSSKPVRRMASSRKLKAALWRRTPVQLVTRSTQQAAAATS